MPVDPNDAAALRTHEVLTELFGPLSGRVRGRERPTVYHYLLSSLIVLRHRDRPAWSRLRDEVRHALDEQWAPQMLLRAIGHRVAALQSAGLPPGPAVRLDEGGGHRTGHYRLITTLTDHHRHPAAGIAELYHRRREIETACLELRSTVLDGRVLRARTPPGIDQEVYALLADYQALRTAMADATAIARVDADRVGFTTLHCG